ncbi:MAG: 4-(cytidine 5'-diphospho)-2-C-methyl-D-erythritol kinase [Proteobacteria bacterium]|nr:4-(cytidine 5'-diphospho)-2-C-methyl-D-erythritol kinase [Pseudomonadota bacterium]MBS0572709.1 4-(cytidine 5'-diphospho)-2-C-methyl-D-erythritol kinase [Pseudomonadota bacterium]
MTTADSGAEAGVEEFAPAKVNLALHVTGRQADGYHLLDSLVVFAGVGDRIEARRAPALTLAVGGTMAEGLPAGDDNLVCRAARLMGVGAAIRLTKVLPLASGIGGGSADAAAALRALARLWGRPLPDAAAVAGLGADVPVCIAGKPARMQGIGERLAPLPALPPFWLVLANPGVAVPTPAVFAALEHRANPPLPPLPGAWPDAAALAGYLGRTRNDLEAPACRLAPEIAAALEALGAQPGAMLARMSGSGATCFGLFADEAGAKGAAERLARARPGWWLAAAAVLAG